MPRAHVLVFCIFWPPVGLPVLFEPVSESSAEINSHVSTTNLSVRFVLYYKWTCVSNAPRWHWAKQRLMAVSRVAGGNKMRFLSGRVMIMDLDTWHFPNNMYVLNVLLLGACVVTVFSSQCWSSPRVLSSVIL